LSRLFWQGRRKCFPVGVFEEPMKRGPTAVVLLGGGKSSTVEKTGGKIVLSMEGVPTVFLIEKGNLPSKTSRGKKVGWGAPLERGKF